jgi:hypothetical protein
MLDQLLGANTHDKLKNALLIRKRGSPSLQACAGLRTGITSLMVHGNAINLIHKNRY